MQSNVIQGKESVKKMLEGTKIATSLIRTAYGNNGVNVSIESQMYPGHEIANDAGTILKAVQTEDKQGTRGLNILKEGLDRINKHSGDARKTTCIIFDEVATRAIDLDIPKPKLKRTLDSYIEKIENLIDEQKTTVDIKDIGKVAKTAGEYEEFEPLFNEIYSKIGKEGIVTAEPSGTSRTYYTVTEGIRFMDTGYLTYSMVHDEEAKKLGQPERKAVYENPAILVTKRKINSVNEINPLLTALMNKGKKDLVIFTDDMDSNVATMLVNTHKEGIMNILIIKAPVIWKQYVFEDFAKVTGATIVEDATGVTFNNLSLEDLGTCGKITVDSEETTILGTADITDHIEYLKSKGDDDSKLRLSWLATKTAIIRLGANNESELSHKRLKCADAISSSYLALKDGVVRGGGISLENVANSLHQGAEFDEIFKEVLLAPKRQLEINAGECVEVPEDVLDSVVSIKNAVRMGISLASTMLTLGGDVSLPEIKEKHEEKMRFM